MNRPALILLAAAGLLLWAAWSDGTANIDGGGLDINNITDNLETMYNKATETASDAPQDVADANISAFLSMIQQSEGTSRNGDAYSVCYGYKHTIQSFSDHPAVTGEWTGEYLPDAMCINAGLSAGCKSTAAGAYQMIKPTWLRLRDRLGLLDFSPASQDRAAVELIQARAALEDVKAGRLADAVHKCRQEWASLPGNTAKQGQRSLETLAAWYSNAGGNIA